MDLLACKKRLVLLLTIVSLLILNSCSQSIDAGQKLYENPAGGYKFRIERDWAFWDMNQGDSFSVAEQYISFRPPIDENGISAASVLVDYTQGDSTELMESTFVSIPGDGKVTDMLLAGEKARRIDYSIEMSSDKKTASYVYCVYDGFTYSIRFICDADKTSMYLSSFETVLSTFEFIPRTAPKRK